MCRLHLNNFNNMQTIRLQDYVVPEFLIEKIDLEFDLQEEATTVVSQLQVIANPANKTKASELALLGESLELLSVVLDGVTLKENQYKVTDHTLTIPNVSAKFNLEITTKIKPQENTALTGLYKSSGNYCTQCEAQGFRRITYYLDRPDVMTKFSTKITAEQKRYPMLLSNGNLVEQGRLDNGRHWVRWEDPFKKPSYLFALVAGDLEFIEDFFTTMSGRKVTLRIYVEKGNSDQCQHAMLAVKKAMRWDEETYGREYDLDIYMIVAVSDFNMGAMENKGLNIFNTKYILAKPSTASDNDYINVESVIAHEYFHNWSGNRVTCRDWFQLSLKEGLTIFRDQSFTMDTTSHAVARIQDVNMLRIQQFPEDMGPLAHPVRPDSYIEINNFYTSTIYNKGAEVIRMMRTMLGEKTFRKAMDLYFSRHDGQAVTIEDFAKAMEDASGMDLQQFRLWYSQAGTPVLDVIDQYDAEKKKYTLIIKQSCPPTPGQPTKLPFHIPVKIGLLDASGKELKIENSLLHLKSGSEVFEFENIHSKPIPSLLRDFSAPVKINYEYSDEALQVLFKHDADDFNRWEAGQKYGINTLLSLVRDHQSGKRFILPQDFIASFRHILSTQQDDKMLLVEMLMLPSEKYLAEQMQVIDPEAIHEAREFLNLEIAKANKDLFLKLYQQNHEAGKPYEFNMEEAGKRQLKNVCLYYLMRLPETDYQQLAMDQFQQALNDNMTDTMGGLNALCQVAGKFREKALANFYQTWQANALVVDKWFSLQAMAKLPDTLAQVRKLMQHPAFDIKNPNKVYALIGAFSHGNLNQFHVASGAGYEFLAEIVLELDSLNPQIAARMVSPLINWKRYDTKRQKLMRQQLEVIAANKKLSKDVYELVSKSLDKQEETI
jgi:aminopeptidase N